MNSPQEYLIEIEEDLRFFSIDFHLRSPMENCIFTGLSLIIDLWSPSG